MVRMGSALKLLKKLDSCQTCGFATMALVVYHYWSNEIVSNLAVVNIVTAGIWVLGVAVVLLVAVDFFFAIVYPWLQNYIFFLEWVYDELREDQFS